jgi:hypothetical protein
MKRFTVIERHVGLTAVVTVVVVAGLASALAFDQGGPKVSPHGNSSASNNGTQVVLAGLFSKTSPTVTNSCGTWANDTNDATYESISTGYGTATRCELLGYTWILTTAGIYSGPLSDIASPPPPGTVYSTPPTILTYSCTPSDSSCLTASAPHPFASWKATDSKAVGYFTPLDLLTPTVIVAATDSGQQVFDVIANQWSVAPSVQVQTCATHWGAFETTATQTNANANITSVEQQFISANPSC